MASVQRRYTLEDIRALTRPYRLEKPPTVEEMDEAIGQAIVEHFTQDKALAKFDGSEPV